MGAEGKVGHGTEQQEHLLHFAVLGPVRAHRDGQDLPMGSPQQRALLAALLLRNGHTATAEELIDGLWGEDPPDRAKAALRTYASRIRKALGADAELLVSESGGYAVRTDRTRSAVTFDHDLASAYASEAEKYLAGGDRSKAREKYASALEQWSGEPLAHVPGPFAERQRDRLSEWHLSLLENRLDLDLQLGAHAGAVSELTALTAAHPLRERLRELLMLALYRSGRQAEALAVYADTRRLLTDELGVDPRPELADLHQRILGADDSLALEPDEPSGPSTPKLAQPAQLPATVADFTGRATFVAELRDQLAQAEGTVMAVSAVAGIGGVGKTTLAVHVAHAAAEHFPDGQLYVDLQGAGPSASEPATVLGAFLRSLGVDDTGIPEGVEERSALFRSLLSGRRVLTLLDNARDAAQVRPLLAGAKGCAALVTSRARMVDLAGAHLVDLDVMSPDEAMTLFTRIVGEERVSAERQAAMDVVGACGFLPLAIRIAAARLAARRTWTVAALASKLADERRRLDELQAGDQAVKATFELGYGQLDAEQGRGFRLLGLAEGPDISLTAAAALLDRPADETENLLESLVDASLLESAAPGRYRFHDLVRLFARACAERDEQPPSEQESALNRLLDFYLATASKVFALEKPGERGAEHLVKPFGPGMVFEDRDAAVNWLFSEADCVLACVEQAAGRGMLRHAADLLIAIKDCADSGVHSLRYERAATTVRDAARAAGDALAEGRTQTMLTHVHVVAGRFSQADEEAKRALLLSQESGDPLAGCWALNDRGIIANCQSRFAEAETHLLQALEAFRADRNRPSEASALSNLSAVSLALGRKDRAIELARQGLEIYENLNHRMRMANGRYALGRALTENGRLTEGLDQLNRAAALFNETRQPLWEGVAHFRMAEAHLADRRPAQAAGHAEQALALRGIGGEWMRGRMLTVLGRALVALGQRDRARVCWKDALAVFDEMGATDAEEVRSLLTPAQAA
ncbi:DNA-binding transcriptional activator of the SARP family [Streptomyces sp. WMMB 714]|uniref:AfsR/SARP family transcriptional regulator n=1 Tax=Streptomyces sp. WMMB 714 TaxID=1286822 RepID=UPI0005F79A94|nr:BTAD domain-containing putative transcriptional regulator [Streptomyces sp. WMMB 714]SCK40391.1 DNA-binding transcriptional activator of the SARP family [Streptomyces sp. WMMB 714]